MSSAQHLATPLPVGAAVVPGTLRAWIEGLRTSGARATLHQAVGIIVPLCVEIAQRHAAGATFYLHPSSIAVDASGRYHLSAELSQRAPVLPRDCACLAPEERGGPPGNARASVFAIGAMLYELVTGLAIGPGMRRPTEVVPSLPAALELMLSKALVADPSHRPDDLNALAQAVHHLAPGASLAPPPADESRLDHDDNFEVDIKLSMIPPLPPREAGSATPYGIVVTQRQREPPPTDSTTELTALKARLESDPRPRYVVVRDGMDHGPFSAVELLQQIATHHFVDSDILRDAFSKDERPVQDWDEFAPFAEHARLHRDIKAEKEAIERVVVLERKSTLSKAAIGVITLGALLTITVVWFLTTRASRKDEIAVQGETAVNIETSAGLKPAGNRRGAGNRGVVGSNNGIPILAGGMSCEGAQARYVEEINIGGPKGPADITGGQYGAILNRGSYFAHCGVPESTSISICAAVQNGRAVGVTVGTNPRNPGVQSCISSAVRGLSFPSNPKLDVTHTNF